MGFYDASRARVTGREFKRANAALRSRGFTSGLRKKIEADLASELAGEGNKKGIDTKEYQKWIKKRKANPGHYGYTRHQIEKIDEELGKHF